MDGRHLLALHLIGEQKDAVLELVDLMLGGGGAAHLGVEAFVQIRHLRRRRRVGAAGEEWRQERARRENAAQLGHVPNVKVYRAILVGAKNRYPPRR